MKTKLLKLKLIIASYRLCSALPTGTEFWPCTMQHRRINVSNSVNGSEIKFILRLAVVSSPVLVLMMRRGPGTSLGSGAWSVLLIMVNYI
jgi:hypothetical protein